MGSSIISDIRSVLQEPGKFWLHCSVLLYFALLPFNEFGVSMPWSLPLFGARVKYTELVLLVVGITVLVAFARGRLRIVRAPILYAFLALNIVAQFTAWFIVSDRPLLLQVGIAVARYSVLVFLLVNVLRSEQLLRAVLAVMGAITAIIVTVVVVQVFLVHGAIGTDSVAWVLGSRVPHTLSYAMVFFGIGLLYLFIRNSYSRLGTVVLVPVLAAWANTIGIAYVKIGQLVALLLLVLLVCVLHGARKKAVIALAVFAIIFAYRYHIVVVQKTAIVWRARIARAVTLPESRGRETSSISPIAEPAFVDWIRGGQVPWSTLAADPLSSVRLAFSTTPVVASVHAQDMSVPQVSEPVTEKPLPETPDESLPPVVVIPPEINVYSEANRLRQTWSPTLAGGSFDVRKRGIAVGWVIGRTFPLTGIGPGQLRDKAQFDAYAAIVRHEAFTRSPYPWKRIFFRTDVIPAADPDKGIFNIFMNAWAETGAPGLIAVLGLIGVVLVMGLRAVLRSWRVHALPVVVFLVPMFIALLVYHQTIYLWVHPWFWTALALTYAAARVPFDQSRVPAGAGERV